MTKSITISPKLKSLLRWMGIDRAVGFGLASRIWSAFASPLNVLLIGLCLTGVEQGYYYTFNSVIGLTIFFELGLGATLGFFISHEWGKLEWATVHEIDGDPIAKGRVSKLFRQSVKYYGAMASLMFLSISVGGYLFFEYGKSPDKCDWTIPWILVVSITALNLLLTPMTLIFSSSGRLAEMTRLNLRGNIAGTLLFFYILIMGGGLYAAPVIPASLLAFTFFWVRRHGAKPLRDLWKFEHPEAPLSWSEEIWPLQWRIAISWMCGYFIFQILTPIVFKFFSEVQAGQMGMTIALCMSVMNVANTWLNAKAPTFGLLIGQQKWAELDSLHRKSLVQAATVGTLGMIVLTAVVFSLNHYGYPLAKRMLPLPELICFELSYILQIIIYGEAVLLRAHRKEPFLILSIGIAVIMVGVCVLSVVEKETLGVRGMAVGFLLTNLFVGLGGGTAIFFRKRREYREPAAC